MTSGDFYTNNSITLISDAAGTARIAEITGGSIVGKITMQRYIDAGATNWRFLTSATSGMTLQEFSGDFETSGFSGSDYPNFPTAASPFTSIYFYDESASGIIDNGYIIPTNITDPVAPGGDKPTPVPPSLPIERYSQYQPAVSVGSNKIVPGTLS